MDQSEIMMCPYNKAHAIVRSRMPAHLMKCVKNYRGEPLLTCPFNAMHKYPENERKNHIKQCEDYIRNYPTKSA